MMKKLYLEVDEEITSVIDKLKNAKEEDISLVFPKDAGLLQSIINLKLLKRQAENLGKKISVITSDKVGRNLAEQVGLTAADHIGSEKAPLPQPPGSMEDSVPIEFRKNLREAEEEEEVIAFKKELLKDTDDDEIKIKESEEIGTSKGDTKDDKEAISDNRIKVKDSDDGNGKKKFKLKLPLKGFSGFVAITFVGLFVFGYIYMPRVEVKIAVASEKAEFETEITADKNEKNSNAEKGILAVESLEFSKEESKKYTATGKKSIGTKATGTIKIENTYSTTSQTLVAGTRFSTDGKLFVSTAKATVPGYSDPGGGIEPGSVNIAVQASEVGSDYNVSSSSDFAIVAFQGTDKYSKIVGTNSEAFTGGDSREATIVTSGDIERAKNELSKEIVEKAKQEAREKAGDEKILKDEVLKVEVVDTYATPGVDAEADQFAMNVKVEVKALLYSEKDLGEVYNKQAEKEGKGTKQIVDNGYDDAMVEVSNIDMKEGTFLLRFKSDVYLSSIMDSNIVKDEIIGQTKENSENYIRSLEGVKNVEMKFWPSFVKRTPRIRNHIIIKAEVSGVNEDDTEGTGSDNE